MPRGGARPGAGRPPDPGSLAEAPRIEPGAIRTLPKARTGGAPAWPLSLTVVIVYAALPAIGPVRNDELPGGEQDVVLVSALLIIYYLGLAFVQQSLPEELLFRGWLLWRLRDRPVWRSR